MALPAFRALVLYAVSSAVAAPRALDQARIHALYNDGEFERVIRALDPYAKGECACARGDSIFAEKHLAVVYAANPDTRERGRFHMHKLLDLVPGGDLLDMFVGDEVD